MTFQVNLERHSVKVLGRLFQFEGEMEPVGPAMDFFNNENRTTFPVFDVKALPIRPSRPLKGIARPEITVSNDEFGLVFFTEAEYRKRVQVLKSYDRVIAYTPHAIVRGCFHRGMETRLRDLFDTMLGVFLVITDATIFPTTQLPAPFPQNADLLIANRHFINLYHQE